MFLGTHTPRLDEKGRLILPAKYREELAAGLVLTKGQERCLYVFPETEVGRITEALRTAPVTAKAVRDYSPVSVASASDEDLDRQGREHAVSGRREGARWERLRGHTCRLCGSGFSSCWHPRLTSPAPFWWTRRWGGPAMRVRC